jgi:hypothetical protein
VPISLRSGPDAALAIPSPTRQDKRRVEEVPDSEEEWDDDLESFGEYDWGDALSLLPLEPDEKYMKAEKDAKKQKLDHLPHKEDTP